MCGIAGIVAPWGARADRAALERMIGTLRHRGPDALGMHVQGRAGLAAARLRVVDLATGDQPLASEDGAVQVVLNGEIYNFGALRGDLERRGHRLATRCDTETLAHLWEDFGEDLVDHLDGMFAFAVWDHRRETLLLARDRMGEKPLYWTYRDGCLIFASELSAVLAHPLVPRRLDPHGVSRYLAFDFVPDPSSMVEDVHKLPPGHRLVATDGKVRVEPYWEIPLAPLASGDADEWAHAIATRFDETVRSRLGADVPLGCFLSGGIDSTAVTATAVRHRSRLRTFSVGYDDPRYDERGFARRVAERLGTDHEELLVGPGDAAGVIERLGDLMDEPLADMSFVPLYLLAAAARRHVTVALTGDGGDELFAGYPTMAAERWQHRFARLPSPVRLGLARLAERLPRSAEPFAEFLRALPYTPEVGNQTLLGGLAPARHRALLAPAARAALVGFDAYDDLTDVLERAPSDDPVARLVYRYAKLYLAGQNLANTDRASMAVALELRAPFLDHRFVELLARLPSSLRLRGVLRPKWLLKRALADRLPEETLRRSKKGFGVPFGTWFRGPLAPLLREILHPERVRRGGVLDAAAVDRLVRDHLSGRADHRRVLWSLLVFEQWRDRYFGSS
jgi:asparagine synthase (glutamine-hydrolysing)